MVRFQDSAWEFVCGGWWMSPDASDKIASAFSLDLIWISPEGMSWMQICKKICSNSYRTTNSMCFLEDQSSESETTEVSNISSQFSYRFPIFQSSLLPRSCPCVSSPLMLPALNNSKLPVFPWEQPSSPRSNWCEPVRGIQNGSFPLSAIALSYAIYHKKPPINEIAGGSERRRYPPTADSQACEPSARKKKGARSSAHRGAFEYSVGGWLVGPAERREHVRCAMMKATESSGIWANGWQVLMSYGWDGGWWLGFIWIWVEAENMQTDLVWRRTGSSSELIKKKLY